MKERVARQLCRELLLLESSDWQFLITTGAARDYAEMRFATHCDQFGELKRMWESLGRDEPITETQLERLMEIETRDPMFPDIDPAMWAAGAHEERPRWTSPRATAPSAPRASTGTS